MKKAIAILDSTLIAVSTFAPFFPGKNPELITVTRYKNAIFPKLEFCIECDGFFRAVYISKQELSEILTGVKIYKKIHPHE